MDAERWSHLQEISDRALRLDDDERQSYLDRTCRSDAELRRQVEELIAARLKKDSFLEGPADIELDDAESARSIDAIVHPPPRYERIERYRVLHEIGRGGVGEVYLATRDDDAYRQRVAIKVLRQGMATDDLLRRFRNERQILASIDHPYIAKLLDGGSTDDGLPYFVMEYIDGVPIDEYCDSRRLGIDERLELFRSVCAAVHLAHQNLVVHRDLKPVNILVNDDGLPKLLDFGIAKLLNPELSAHTIEATSVGARLLTPQYASPEQCLGESITTASDVYSLGVLLYELLTGRRPYEFTNLANMTQVICEEDPPPPSVIVRRDGGPAAPAEIADRRDTTPEKLARKLSGDLDDVVLKAMRKEPHQRYGSVEQLSEEIRRHLAGLPVSASKDTLVYRARKFVRRHVVAVGATAAVFLALTVGLTLAVTGLVRARRAEAIAAQERDAAALENAKADAINDFLTNMLSAASPEMAQGEQVTVRRILDEASKRLRTDDALRNEREVEATIRETIGKTYMALGDFDEARRHLERALRLNEETLGESHPNTIASLNQMAVLSWQEGRLEDGEVLARKALALGEDVLGVHHVETLRAKSNVALLRLEQGDVEEAEVLYEDVLENRRRILGDEHPDTLETMNDLGTLYMNVGRANEAEALLLRVLAQTREQLGENHPRVAAHLNNLGVLYRNLARYDESETFLVEALSLSRSILGEEHPDTLNSMNSLAALYRDLKRYQDAAPLYHQLVSVLRRKMPSFFGTAVALQGYGLCLFELRDYAAAEPLFLEAHRIFEHAPHPAGVDHTVASLADLYEAWGRPSEAKAWRERVPKTPPP